MNNQTSPGPRPETKADLYVDPSRTTTPGTTEVGNPVRWNIGDIPTGDQYSITASWRTVAGGIP